MTILTYPDNIIPDSIDWRIQYNTQVFTSPFNRVTQTAELPGARWVARMSYSNLQQDELRQLSSFFIQLRGRAGRFTLYDMSLPTPQNGTTANATVASATRTTVTLTENRSADITPGDYITVSPGKGASAPVAGDNVELKMVTAVSGAVLTVEPPFRVVPASPDVVVLDKAFSNMMLDSDDQVGWSSTGSIYLSNFTVSCMEAING